MHCDSLELETVDGRFKPSSSLHLPESHSAQSAMKFQTGHLRAYPDTAQPTQRRDTSTPLHKQQSLPGGSSPDSSPYPIAPETPTRRRALRTERGARLVVWKEDSQSEERMWAIYLEHSEKVGPRARAWRADADGVLTFSALFSALVAAFMIESYKALGPDYTAASALMLSQLAILHNETSSLAPPHLKLDKAQVVYNASLSAALGNPSPRDYVTNALWISSLLVSVTSALCAVMIQQWTRRFESMCDGHFHRLGLTSTEAARVRLHVLGATSEDEFAKYIETIPRYLHASVFLFIAGLLVFFASFDTIVVCICIGFAVLYLLDWYTSMTMSVLRNPATLFQTPLTTGIWLFATKFLVAWDQPRGFGDIFKQAFIGMFYIPGDILRFYSRTDSPPMYPSLRDHHHLSFDDAVIRALGRSLPDAGFAAAELVSVFQSLRSPSSDTLNASCTFVAGLCWVISQDASQALRVELLRGMHEDTSHHGSWESWLLSILSACDTGSSLHLQFAALCLRLHYYQLVHMQRGSSTSHECHTPDLAIPDPGALTALQELERHPEHEVALAARYFRVWLAAGLDGQWSVDYDDASTCTADVFWQFVWGRPDWQQLSNAVGIDPATLARPRNRCVAIARTLRSDICSYDLHSSKGKALLQCIESLPDQVVRAAYADLLEEDVMDPTALAVLEALCERVQDNRMRLALFELQSRSNDHTPLLPQGSTTATLRNSTTPSLLKSEESVPLESPQSSLARLKQRVERLLSSSKRHDTFSLGVP